MNCIISHAGKQFYVKEESLLHISSHLPCEVGKEFTFTNIKMHMVNNQVKLNPKVTVTALVLEHTRGEKVLVGKKHRRKGYRRTQGHRQDLTKVKIVKIQELGAKDVK